MKHLILLIFFFASVDTAFACYQSELNGQFRDLAKNYHTEFNSCYEKFEKKESSCTDLLLIIGCVLENPDIKKEQEGIVEHMTSWKQMAWFTKHTVLLFLVLGMTLALQDFLRLNMEKLQYIPLLFYFLFLIYYFFW